MNQLSVKDIEKLVFDKFGNSKRYIHILGVARLAKELANKFGLDEEKAYVTGLLHDFCKYETIDEMKEHLENLIIRLRDQEKLTEREKEVFCYKLGLCGYELLEKQGDIARKMNISDAAVSNAFKKSFAVLQDAASKDV